MMHNVKGKWYGPCKRCGKEMLQSERTPHIMRNSLIGQGKRKNRRFICKECRKPSMPSGNIDPRSIMAMKDPALYLSAKEYSNKYGKQITESYLNKIKEIKRQRDIVILHSSPEYIKEQRRVKYLLNKDKREKQRKEYYNKHREEAIEYARVYRKKNKDKLKKYWIEYYKNNNDKEIARVKRYQTK